MSHLPWGLPPVTPYLIVDGAAHAIEFYTEVLSPAECVRMGGGDGRVGHAELTLGTLIPIYAVCAAP